MSLGRFWGAVAVAAALFAVPVASGATPSQIYDDFADNGRLDARYSPADLRAALAEPAAQVYEHEEIVEQARPTIVRQIEEQEQPLQTVRERGGLPFTGLDLALLAAGGGFLLLVGASMRRLAKAKSKQ